MSLKIGDKVKTLVGIRAIEMYSEGVITGFANNHKFPVEVSFSGRCSAYYTEDELTHA